jgi:hypothetical protein
MHAIRILACGVAALALALPALLACTLIEDQIDKEVKARREKAEPARTAEVPADARNLIDEYDKESKALKEKAEQEIKEKREKLIERLKQLQDTYTRAGKLEEAVAIRDTIKRMKQGALDIKPDPGTLGAYRTQIGKTFVFEVTGRTDATIWGTGVYTDDSALATVAVHAGALKVGQKGLVRVTILPAEMSYEGSTSNGVTSNPYGEFGGSYRVDAVKE